MREFVYGYPIDGPYDFELYKDAEGKYSFFAETIMDFDNEAIGSRQMLKNILKDFTKWMDNNGFDTAFRLGFKSVFAEGLPMDRKYDTVEQAYAAFRILALGYICEVEKSEGYWNDRMEVLKKYTDDFLKDLTEQLIIYDSKT